MSQTQVQDLVTSVQILVPQTVEVGITLKELTLSRATPTVPGVMAVLLAPLDDAGEFRDDIPPTLARVEDDLSSEDPQKRNASSMFQNLIFTALVADTPQHQALGIVGMNVYDAAKVILPSILAGPPEAPDDPTEGPGQPEEDTQEEALP